MLGGTSTGCLRSYPAIVRGPSCWFRRNQPEICRQAVEGGWRPPVCASGGQKSAIRSFTWDLCACLDTWGQTATTWQSILSVQMLSCHHFCSTCTAVCLQMVEMLESTSAIFEAMLLCEMRMDDNAIPFIFLQHLLGLSAQTLCNSSRVLKA